MIVAGSGWEGEGDSGGEWGSGREGEGDSGGEWLGGRG